MAELKPAQNVASGRWFFGSAKGVTGKRGEGRGK